MELRIFSAIVLGLFAKCVHTVYGYPSGAPWCGVDTPQHGFLQPTAPPYSIATSATTYAPGETVAGAFLPLDEAIDSRVVFVIVSGSDERAHGRADRQTLLEPAK